MRHRVTFVYHQGYVPIDVLKWIEFSGGISRSKGANGPVGAGPLRRGIELSVPLSRILGGEERHTVTPPSLLPRAAPRPRAREPWLGGNKNRTIGKIKYCPA